MELFLIANNKYSYKDIIETVNRSNSYCPLLKTNNLFDYFVNLIVALVSDKPLVLIDSDISQNELNDINQKDVNKRQSLSHPHFSNIDEIIEALLGSNSEITIFTSGTTGQPKKVVHTVNSLARAVRRGDKYKVQIWGYAYNPTHMAGLQGFFQAFTNTSTLVNIFAKSREEVYKAIEDNAITHLSATPTFYRLLLPFEKTYPSVVRASLGGEKSDSHLYEEINRIFPNAKINNIYASTEAGSLFAAKGDSFQIPENIRSKFMVKDNELLIHKSLLGQSKSFSFDGEYYHSGDLIEWVNPEQGLFRFKSRINELINVGGYKVNPGEVENIINSINGVRQAVVYGKANSVLGNVLCADIVVEDGCELKESDIRKIISERLQDFKVPRRIKIKDHLGLTRTGKLKRV